MFAFRNVRKFMIFAGSTPVSNVTTTTNLCRAKPVRVVLKRDASIHTRHILIQKLKFEHMTNFGITLLIFPAATFALGVWQVKRKIWKEGLIAEIQSQLKQRPVDLPENLADLNQMEYQPVKVRGRFLHDKELYLGPRSLIESTEKSSGGVLSMTPKTGYFVITPFQLEGREEVILVNRGWVSKRNLNPKMRDSAQVDGVVELTGIVRRHENRPQFVPKVEGDIYLFRDIHRMCRMTGAEPYFIDATHDTTIRGGPIGGQTTVNLRNEHLAYIVTWFSLSGLSLLMWYKLVYSIPK